MEHALLILIVALFICILALSIMLLVMLEWSHKADKELDMQYNITEDHAKRIKALERLTFDIETEIRKEVYQQINKRELERMVFKCNSNALYGKQVSTKPFKVTDVD